MSVDSATYTDLDLSFIPHPITKNARILKDEAAIGQAIKRIVLTSHGEVPFEFFKGGNTRALLFEAGDGVTAFLLKRTIQEAIDKFEKRVRVLSVDVKYENDNDCFVSIEFEVVAINRFSSVEFNLSRIR